MAEKENNKVVSIEPENKEPEIKEKREHFVWIKKVFRKKSKENPENPEEAEDKPERRTFGQWLSDSWYWIAGGGLAMIAFILLVAKYASESTDEETVDPDIETEPGDWEPDEDDESETSEEPETEIEEN